MATGTAIDSQWSIAEENTYGLWTAGARYLPVTNPDVVSYKRDPLESKGIYAGRITTDATQMAQGGNITAKAKIMSELYDRSMGLYLKHCMGGYAISGPSGGLYTQTFTPGSLSAAKGFTGQEGMPQTDGTVIPRTINGLLVDKWTINGKNGENATLEMDCIGRDVCHTRSVTDGVTSNGSPTVTSATAAWTESDLFQPIAGTGIPANSFIGKIDSATQIKLSSSPLVHTAVNASASGTSITFTMGFALGSASYPSSLTPFAVSTSLDVTIDGTSVPFEDFTLSGDNKLQTRYLSQPRTQEPKRNDVAEYTGTLTPEWTGLTQYNKFLKGTQAALVATFAAPGSTYSLTATANVIFTEAEPQGSGRGIVKNPLKFKCLGSTDAAALTIVAVNADSSY